MRNILKQDGYRVVQKLLNEKLDGRLCASPDVTMVIKSMAHVAHMQKQENEFGE
jgi:hypothetical protein